MIRLINLLAITVLIGTAFWNYSVKYDTILLAEKVHKRETELKREKDSVQILAAEWELLNRPTRLQALVRPEGSMVQISARQIVRPTDIPHTPQGHADPLDALLTGALPALALSGRKPQETAQPLPAAPQPLRSATSPANTLRPTTIPQRLVTSPLNAPKQTAKDPQPKDPQSATPQGSKSQSTTTPRPPIDIRPVTELGPPRQGAPEPGALTDFLKKLIR